MWASKGISGLVLKTHLIAVSGGEKGTQVPPTQQSKLEGIISPGFSKATRANGWGAAEVWDPGLIEGLRVQSERFSETPALSSTEFGSECALGHTPPPLPACLHPPQKEGTLMMAPFPRIALIHVKEEETHPPTFKRLIDASYLAGMDGACVLALCQ